MGHVDEDVTNVSIIWLTHDYILWIIVFKEKNYSFKNVSANIFPYATNGGFRRVRE